MRKSLPVHILSGYLGAGKTTVLNTLLGTDHGLRIGVLVNDFGAINVDAALIAQQDAEVLALTNGCACCTIANDLGQALNQIQSPALAIDQVIIEASGVADPFKLAQLAMTWPGFELGTITTVVDVCDIARLCRDRYVGPIVRQQLQVADYLLPSKLDLSSAATNGEVLDWLSDANPRTTVLRSDVRASLAQLLVGGEPRPPRSALPPHESVEHTQIFHTRTFTDLRVVTPQCALRLLSNLPATIVRAKGLIAVDDESAPWREVQLAGKRGSLMATAIRPNRTFVGGLVFCWVGDRDIGPQIEARLTEIGFINRC